MNLGIKMKIKSEEKIAIVGMSAWYPGSKSLLELWENVLAKRVQFREIPKERLPLDEYYDENPTALDKTYATRVAAIDGYEFDWMNKRIPKQMYEATDPVQWLALDMTIKMFEDANIDINTLPKESTGVILGNTMTGDVTRPKYFRARWPFVRKSLRATAEKSGMNSADISKLETSMEAVFKSVFKTTTEDTMAGELSNTIAGRISNYFNIQGGGHTVDGACSSSLISVITASDRLLSGDLDFAIAGGVDLSLDTFELIGFSKMGALSKSEMRVYDKRGDGFIAGEGCGIIGLKRLSDAKRDGNKVYATLDGWGLSSDGKSGIATPTIDGQVLALRRAYNQANLNPADLDFVEGHGTGTKVGDYIELTAMADAIDKDKNIKPSSFGVTSFKSIVGHTKAASGVGGLIKTAIALNQRIMPPIASCDLPHGLFSTKANILYPLTEGEIKPENSLMKAGVSSMGFGGINTHVVLSSADKPYEQFKSKLSYDELFSSDQDCEVFIFSASSQEELKDKVEYLIEEVRQASYAELADIAKMYASCINNNETIRASVLVSTPFEAAKKLEKLVDILKTKCFVSTVYEDEDIFISSDSIEKEIGFVFPGQGSQQVNSAKKLIARYDWAKDMLMDAKQIFAKYNQESMIDSFFINLDKLTTIEEQNQCHKNLRETQIAQPAIVLSSIIWYEYMLKAGIKPSVVAGHSLGELTAFYSAGCFNFKEVMEISVLRGQEMASKDKMPGAMASLMCNESRANELISKLVKGYVSIANLNSATQTVVSGEKDAISQLVELALGENVRAVELAVSNAFHSKIVSSAAKGFKDKFPFSEKINTLNTPIISSTDGKLVEKSLNLKEHFSQQIVKKVDFIKTSKEIASRAEIILEVGPSGILSKLIKANEKDILVYPTAVNPKSFKDINKVFALLFVHGHQLNWDYIYSKRLIRDFIPARKLKFITNPCELEFSQESLDAILPLDLKVSSPNTDTSVKEKIENIPLKISQNTEKKVVTGKSSVEVLLEIASNMTGFPLESLSGDMHLLDDLNMDSIKAGELIASATMQLKITKEIDPMALAGLSLSGIAKYLDSLKPSEIIEKKVVIGKSSVEVLLEIASNMTGFPLESLSGDMHLLDDLNMDSIKAGELIASATMQLKITKEIDPMALAGLSLSGIAKYLDSLKPSEIIEKKKSLEVKEQMSWVRSFSLNSTYENLDAKTCSVDKLSISSKFVDEIAILHDKESEGLAKAINHKLSEYGLKSTLSTYKAYRSQSKDVIAILPKPDETSMFDPISIKRALEYISSALKNPLHSLNYIQFDSPVFSDNKVFDIQSGCANAYVASAHFESKNTRMRVLDFDSKLNDKTIVNALIQEQMLEDIYSFSSYDKRGLRRINTPELYEVQLEKQRVHQLSEKDVIIVTGGAKGITAECALALAIKTGAKMALVGSSSLPADEDLENEIIQTLKRFKASGITHNYYSCDISKYEDVESMTKKIENDFGKISCIVHGAGINNFGRASGLDVEKAVHDCSPKIVGIMNLCKSCDSSSLRLIVGLSSIIGMTGMPGNSVYGFSNEALNIVLQNYKYINPKTDVISIAYSVWAEVGMGAKMGSTKSLEKMGIFAIEVDKGVEHFLRLIEHKSKYPFVAVSAKLGGLDTWKQKVYTKPMANRFLEEILHLDNEVELVCKVDLSLENDKYLKDHKFRNIYLMPTVFGLEAMGQATAMVLGKNNFNEGVIVENIQLSQPIIVTEDRETPVYIKAEVLEKTTKYPEDRVQVYMSTKENDFNMAEFRALFRIKLPEKQKNKIPDFNELKSSIQPKQELYGHQLFQGEIFQRIDKVYDMNSKEVYSNINFTSVLNAYASKFSSQMILGNPCSRDALLQTAQLTESKMYLPVKIEQLKVYPFINGKSYIAHTQVVERNEKEIKHKVMVSDINGNLVEELDGYVSKQIGNKKMFIEAEIFSKPQNNDQLIFNTEFTKVTEAFAFNYPEVSLEYDENFYDGDKTYRHEAEQSFLDKGKKNITLKWNEEGKPLLNNDNCISISHNQAHILISIGETQQGCDIEMITSRSEDEWNGLLGKYNKNIEKLIEKGDSLNQAGTRIWSALESYFKACNKMATNLVLTSYKDGVALFKIEAEDKEIQIITFPIKFTRNAEKIVAVIVNTIKVESLKNTNNLIPEEQSSSEFKGFKERFAVSFKDSTLLQKMVDYTMFATWMGKLRESALFEIGDNIVKDSCSGKYAWVTNQSNVEIYSMIESFDLIEGRVWTSQRFGLKNSSNILHFEWYKIKDNNKKERIAYCEMSTTWVVIKEHGIVEAAPYPDYLDAFMKRIETADSSKKSLEELAYNKTNQIKNLNLSQKVLYRAKNEPIIKPLLHTQIVETSMEHSNLIGNVYFAHYYAWQKLCIDRHLYKIIPEYYKGIGEEGELFGIYSEVNHLREAMPFYSVKITMHLKVLHDNGMELSFNYYGQAEENQDWIKLANGSYHGVWVKKKNTSLTALKLPQAILNTIVER